MITNTQLEYRGNQFPSTIKSFEQTINNLFFTTENGVVLCITVLRDSLLRFRFTTEGVFENDFSYAIDEESVHGYNKLEVVEETYKYVITTNKVKCILNKGDLRIGLYDLEGNAILEDELGFHWEENHEYGGNIVKMSKATVDGESFYGMGDKPMHFNLKGKRVSNWNTDEYAFSIDKDPLYKTVPFYIGLRRGVSYGVFFDNTFRTYFDFCHERRNVTSFWADGGEMNYYFFYGPSMESVVSVYTDLTGKPELPPLWALGYHQCKWSYYPESKVREVTSKFRELQIPCDAIYLDIDYMEGFRCFTWNKTYFPDPKKMVSDLTAQGFKTIVIIDPGIKVDPDYEVFKEALEKDYFCHRADGPYMRGKVWPGRCYFPDFTNPEVREWWVDLFEELIEDIGVKGVWNDMNEPAVMEVPSKTFPLDVRHDYDGNPCSHRKAHNVYGMQMSRATYEGVKKFAYPKRPFIITRAAYSGTQRYTSFWTGDNVASWEHLWLATVQIQRMCISGMSFCGTDIGGFAEQPTGELYARWIQLGVFHPFCRTHSSGDHGEQEPWSFDEDVLNITRKYIELRYTLLPYLYTAFWKYSTKGEPILKPLVYFDQSDVQTHYRTDEFVFGRQILVCPILEFNVQGRRMYIPRGKWYNYWTDEVVTGGREMWVEAPLHIIPMFIKEGAMIPRYPVQQYVGEKKIEELIIDVYYKLGEEKSTVYEDGADGYDYTKGRYSLMNFKLIGKKDEVIIQQHYEGDFGTEYEDLVLRLHGVPFEIKTVFIDNEEVKPEDLTWSSENALKVNKIFYDLRLVGVK